MSFEAVLKSKNPNTVVSTAAPTDRDLSVEPAVTIWSNRYNSGGWATISLQTSGERGERVRLMGPNVRTYLFHPLPQVIACLSVWPGLKR